MISGKTNVKGLGIVVQSDGDLYTNVKDLRRRLISPRDEAYARIHTARKENIGKTEGTRVSMIASSLKGELPVWQRNLIFPKNLDKALVDANSQNKYYSTGLTDEYEQARKKADAEKKQGIDPKDRSAIVCPSRKNFEMSLSKNREQLDFILQDLAKQYLQLNRGPIEFYPIDADIVDGTQPNLLTKPYGTIQNYMWFRCLDVRSVLVGGSRFAYFSHRARGVFKKSAEGTSPKISLPSFKKIVKYSRKFVPDAVRKEFERGLSEILEK